MRVIAELMHYPRRRMQSVLQQSAFCDVQFSFRSCEVHFLALAAFAVTLRPRQTEYQALIAEIESKK